MEENQEELSDEQAIMKIAQAMKDNAPTQDEKQNVHTFLVNVIQAEDTLKVAKLGNLRDDKELNELGLPAWNVRGALDMARISDKLMSNDFFKNYFEASSNETNSTSLSREGFVIRQATTQTKQIADTTRRKKINKGWFSRKEETSGGDITGAAGNN
jgi:hypothetical protein